jgi:RNA polymerase sigma-70 factor (ECF subfamily)
MSHPPEDNDLDLMLVEKIRNGTEAEKSASQEKLYKRWYPNVYKFFIRKGFTEVECEDLTQDSFLRVFNSIDDFRGKHFGGWLSTIPLNVRNNEIRRRRTFKRDARETSFEQLQEDDPAILVDRSSVGAPPRQNVLDAMVDKEDKEDLHRAIARMPAKMRSCCFMRYGQGMKYREIAVALKISIGTVKAHLAQARERLRGELGIDLAPEPGD